MKLMVWNIQFFTISKVFNNSGPEQADLQRAEKIFKERGMPENQFKERIQKFHQSRLVLNKTQSRLNNHYILDHIHRGSPDIFVLIENRSSQGRLGSLIDGNGAAGALFILQYLREINASWCLVPPLRTVNRDPLGNGTYTEGMSVYYRADRLNFIGPYVWPAAAPTQGPKVAVPNTGVATADYPIPWRNCLPANNHYAGQFQFFDGNGTEILFENANHRRPFLTRFREQGGQQRTINLLAVHNAPNNASARTATSRMGNIREINNPGNNEVSVIAGDFNINIYGNIMDRAFFNSFLHLYGFRQHFGTDQGPTTIRSVNQATLVGQAPGYGYLKREGLDNIFTKYGQNTFRPQNHNPLVLNRVVGVNGYPPHMENSIEEMAKIVRNMSEPPNNQPLAGDNPKLLEIFRHMYNYGHIGNYPGVSDHMALVMDI
jgi:hypothetical protein